MLFRSGVRVVRAVMVMIVRAAASVMTTGLVARVVMMVVVRAGRSVMMTVRPGRSVSLGQRLSVANAR